jgi:hypothetical protein
LSSEHQIAQQTSPLTDSIAALVTKNKRFTSLSHEDHIILQTSPLKDSVAALLTNKRCNQLSPEAIFFIMCDPSMNKL